METHPISVHLVLEAWKGPDPVRAGGHLARVFRLNPDRAVEIVRQVARGAPWKFERNVSPQQADKVIPYLRALGFQVTSTANTSFIRLHDSPSPAHKVEEDVAEDAAEEQEAVRLSRRTGVLEFSFRADAWDITALYLKLWVFSLLTLGVYSFFGRTNLRRYLLGRTALGGKPFAYSGTPQDLIRNGVTAAIALLGLFVLLIIVHQQDPLLSPVAESAGLVLVLVGLVFLRWRYVVFLNSSVLWQGVAFSFQARFADWLALHLKGGLLCVFTLGLYGPVYWTEVWAFGKARTRFGNKPLRYSGYWKDMARPYYIAWAVTLFTLGWGCPVWLWALPEIRKALWARTHFDNGTFEYNADWRIYNRMAVGNILILLFSIGIGYGVVKLRSREFYARHLALTGLKNWPELVRKLNAGRRT